MKKLDNQYKERNKGGIHTKPHKENKKDIKGQNKCWRKKRRNKGTGENLKNSE